MPPKTLSKIFIIPLLIVVLYTVIVDFLYGETGKKIPAPSKERAYEEMVRKVRSFTVAGKILRYLGSEGKYLVTTDISKPKNDLKPFISSKKEPIEAIKVSKMNLISMYKKDHYLILNGADNEIYFYSPDNRLISRHSIPYDLIRPARDRGGEAPEWEISDLRVKFKRNFMQRGYDKFTGFVSVPKAWMSSSKDLYFVSSRIKGFPILILACNQVNPSQCSIHRSCMVEGGHFKDAIFTGIATVPSAKLILMGRKDTHSIDVFRYQSCMHIIKTDTLILPKQLKEISNIGVDSDRNLWVSTLMPDDYLNSSLFSWEEKFWMPLLK